MAFANGRWRLTANEKWLLLQTPHRTLPLLAHGLERMHLDGDDLWDVLDVWSDHDPDALSALLKLNEGDVRRIEWRAVASDDRPAFDPVDASLNRAKVQRIIDTLDEAHSGAKTSLAFCEDVWLWFRIRAALSEADSAERYEALQSIIWDLPEREEVYRFWQYRLEATDAFEAARDLVADMARRHDLSCKGMCGKGSL